MSEKKDNRMPDELVKQIRSEEDVVPGRPYLITCTFGWAFVGYYIDRPDPLCLRFSFCRHFANAGKHYGKIATEGLDADATEQKVRKHGRWKCIERMQIISIEPYHGEAFYGK